MSSSTFWVNLLGVFFWTGLCSNQPPGTEEVLVRFRVVLFLAPPAKVVDIAKLELCSLIAVAGRHEPIRHRVLAHVSLPSVVREPLLCTPAC